MGDLERFEVGKYYRHSGGCMHIIGVVKSTLYGWALVAEEHGSGNFIPVGSGEGHTVGWRETTEEDWLNGFDSEQPKVHGQMRSVLCTDFL